MANPFLDVSGFPDFPAMTPQAAREAFPVLLGKASAAADALERSVRPEWDAIFPPLHEAQHPLMRAWGLVSHLLSVCNSPGWREVQREFQDKVVAFGLRVSQSRPLYDAASALLRRAGTLPPARRRILEKFVRDLELSGVGLEGAARERFNAVQQELAGLASKFRDNVLDSTRAFSLEVRDRARMAGLPPSVLAQTCVSDDPEKGPWKITIDDAVYPGFMKHAADRDLREKVYRARSVRASSGETDNTAAISRILELRAETARLLGFPDYVSLSVSSKTAGTPQAVRKMTDELAAAALPCAERENAALAAFAAANGGPAELKPWDRAFWAERLREAKYSYSEEELSEYFDFPAVLKGLFALAERLFGVTVEPADGEAPVWHRDVRFFRVLEDGRTIARFYLDPYSRPESKSGGAWMNEIDTRAVSPGGATELPLALIVCNQRKPAPDGRSPMLFREVETLFHEFGHALQHMLTRVDDREASGLNLVDWDAVEVASQFMENWCTDRTTLSSTARHSKTGAPLPEDLLRKVVDARNYRAGAACARQLSFSDIDMTLHSAAWDPARDGTPDDVKNRIFGHYTPGSFEPGTDRFLNAFTHIFSGGYAAGYYSYKWSEVMSADAFAAFEEAGLGDDAAMRATGRRYRETILALGGSKDPMEVFREFRGRAPSVDALLRQTGLLDGAK